MRVQDGWMRDLQTVDDVSFDATLKRMGLNVLTSHSEAFLGHSPARSFWEARYAQYETVPPCQKMCKGVSSKCKQKYGQVNQIVVLHSFVERGLPYGKLVFNAPDDLWYWNDYPKWTIDVCRSTRNPNLLERLKSPHGHIEDLRCQDDHYHGRNSKLSVETAISAESFKERYKRPYPPAFQQWDFRINRKIFALLQQSLQRLLRI
jgi:hypothetical protein